MSKSAPRYKGKFKKEIAAEAFAKLGPNATNDQVDKYFKKHYGLPRCEPSMYWAAKRLAEGRPAPLIRSLKPTYSRHREPTNDIVGIVIRLRQLAVDCGGYDVLEDLIRALKPGP